MASEAKLHSDSDRGREQSLSNKEVTMETKPQSTGVGNLGFMWGGGGWGKKRVKVRKQIEHIAKAEQKQNKGT